MSPHAPVLLAEVIETLAPRPGHLIIDATFGAGFSSISTDHWRTLAYPFGSEMAWDSTGQAEVYAWMRHFGYTRQADITREVILGYDPAMIKLWGGLTAGCMAGVFWIAWNMLKVVFKFQRASRK